MNTTATTQSQKVKIARRGERGRYARGWFVVVFARRHEIAIKELTAFSIFCTIVKYEFPVKLFRILQDMDKENRKDIISWLPSGDSFRIHDVEKFSKDVLPTYCNGIQYKSFIRNINLYCFQRSIGGYYHPMFKRDQLELCMKITRPKRPRYDGKKAREEQNASAWKEDEGLEHVFEGTAQVGTGSKVSNASFEAPPASIISLPAVHMQTTTSTPQNSSWSLRDLPPGDLVDLEPRPMWCGPTLKLPQIQAGESFQSKSDGLGKFHPVDRSSSGLMMPPSMESEVENDVILGQAQHQREASHRSSTFETSWMLNMNFKLWECLDNVGKNSVEGSPTYYSNLKNQGNQPQFQQYDQEQDDDDDDSCSQVSELEYSEEYNDLANEDDGVGLSFES
jgi:hypothetical protein